MKKILFISSILILLSIFSCQNGTVTDESLSSRDNVYTEEWYEMDRSIDNPRPRLSAIDSILPKTFFNARVKKYLADTFGVDDPSSVLKVQAISLQEAQVRYGYRWAGVAVGYGMMPMSGSFWEGFFMGSSYTWKQYLGKVEKIKKLLMFPLITNRKAQNKLYKWAKPTISKSFSSKPDTAQALDMFAVWKASKYLAQYNDSIELLREKTITLTDWRNKEDHDAKLYAFWHRRIKEYTKYGSGFSLEDSRYWTDVALSDMNKLAHPSTKKILKEWKKLWEKGKFTCPYMRG